MNTSVIFIDHPAILQKADKYTITDVNSACVLKSWKKSLFSYEWLNPDGTIRAIDELPIREREKRLSVEERLKQGSPLERPVLGIGLMDNAEIGTGKAVFLTLASMGFDCISVHIPKSNAEEYKAFC